MCHTVILTPPISDSERFGGLKEAGAVMPGLGVLSLAACLRKEGLPVSLLDAEGTGLDMARTVDRIASLTPRIVGITSTTLSFHSALAAAAALKERLPGVVTVLGGPHVTALPRQCMENHPEVDAVIPGDGETGFTRLVQNVSRGAPAHSQVEGIFYRQGEEILETPKTGHLQDLDRLPFPAWDMLEGFPKIYRPAFHSYRKLPLANIVTARGCPWACAFCDRSVFGRKVYSHSLEYVVEMIQYLVKDFAIREISIKDDTFTTSAERVAGFARLLAKKNLKIAWSCNARAGDVDGDILKEMKRAGCWMISFGIESGSPQLLKKMLKGITHEQVTRALELTRKAGITSKGFFMIGVPGETKETLRQTMAFVKKIPLDEISVNYFTPFPGSRLYKEVLEEGLKPDFKRMNMQDVVYVPRGLETKDLRTAFQAIVYKFYLRPLKLLRYVSRGLKNYGEMKRVYRMGRVFANILLTSVKRKFAGKKRITKEDNKRG